MNKKNKKIWIFGLGKFGMSIAEKLIQESDIDLALVDRNSANLDNYKRENLSLNLIDSERPNALKELDIQKQDIAVVSMGSSLGASILTCQSLLDIGLKEIYVRAIDERHKRIMKSIGINEKNIIHPYKIAADNFFYKMIHDFEILMKDQKSNHLILRIINEKQTKTLKELKLDKKNIQIILINQAETEKAIIPNGSTKLNVGDILSILVDKKNEKNICKFFQN